MARNGFNQPLLFQKNEKDYVVVLKYSRFYFSKNERCFGFEEKFLENYLKKYQISTASYFSSHTYGHKIIYLFTTLFKMSYNIPKVKMVCICQEPFVYHSECIEKTYKVMILFIFTILFTENITL